MDDYISRNEFAEHLADIQSGEAPTGRTGENIDYQNGVCAGFDMAYVALKQFPAADVVARDCYDRILSESDTMRSQLAEVGKKVGDTMDDVRPVAEISDAVDEVLDYLSGNSNCMPYHIYSALFDLVCGICPNCGADMRKDKHDKRGA